MATKIIIHTSKKKVADASPEDERVLRNALSELAGKLSQLIGPAAIVDKTIADKLRVLEGQIDTARRTLFKLR